MSNFEKKFGKYAIRNLSLVLILCYACGYLIQFVNSGFLHYLTLNPYAILHGQVWRLVTWIIVPPDASNLFFVLIMLYFYFSIGTTLENIWGTYRYNLYIFSGMLFTILGSFVLMAYSYLFHGETIMVYGAENYFRSVALLFSTYYVNMSIFLAFAATFPEATVLLMFIIPVKIKWLGIIYAVLLGAQFLMGPIYSKFVIAASLMNFLVFWFTSRNHMHMNPKQIHRRQEFKRDIKRNTSITRHKCAICGRTELDCPEMQFRFCSKCDGNYEYCEEHLYTHTHVKKN